MVCRKITNVCHPFLRTLTVASKIPIAVNANSTLSETVTFPRFDSSRSTVKIALVQCIYCLDVKVTGDFGLPNYSLGAFLLCLNCDAMAFLSEGELSVVHNRQVIVRCFQRLWRMTWDVKIIVAALWEPSIQHFNILVPVRPVHLVIQSHDVSQLVDQRFS